MLRLARRVLETARKRALWARSRARIVRASAAVGGLDAAVRAMQHWAGIGGPGDAMLAAIPPGARDAVWLRPGTADAVVFQQIFRERQYGPALRRHPRTIVDAGAHIGLASVFFALHCPGARIVAIEPAPDNFALLTRNVAPYPAITPVHAALWPEPGRVVVETDARDPWGHRVRADDRPGVRADDRSGAARGPDAERSVEGSSAAAVTVEQILDQHGIDRLDVLKIDIEGSEREVFDHAAPWIERVDFIVAELHDRLRPGCSRSFAEATRAFPRRVHRGDLHFAMRTRPPARTG